MKYSNFYGSYGDKTVAGLDNLKLLRGRLQTEINDMGVLQKEQAGLKNFEAAKAYSQYIKELQKQIKAYNYIQSNWYEGSTPISEYPKELAIELTVAFTQIERASA